jgi:N-acetylglucosamine-6-phosphate deacetylase
MIVLSGATLVLPDRLLSPGTLVIDEGRIAEIRSDAPPPGHAPSQFAFHGHYIVPFVDVRARRRGRRLGDPDDSIASMAERLPLRRHGLLPTTIACAPDALRHVLARFAARGRFPMPRSARVLPAHLGATS